MDLNPKVDAHLGQVKRWREETALLRGLLLDSELTEEFKWGKPCYTFQDHNVIIIQGFKEYCALLFCKGALLPNADGRLIAPGENTQAARQLRFMGVQEIVEIKVRLRQLVAAAIAVERAGLQVQYKSNAELILPEELQGRLAADSTLRAAFAGLTPGRQRGYQLFISAAKQSKTRAARVEKCRPRILAGKGLNDD